jgi:hypothetical protein
MLPHHQGKNPKPFLGFKLLIQRGIMRELVQTKGDVEMARNFKQQLCRTTWKNNMGPIWIR